MSYSKEDFSKIGSEVEWCLEFVDPMHGQTWKVCTVEITQERFMDARVQAQGARDPIAAQTGGLARQLERFFQAKRHLLNPGRYIFLPPAVTSYLSARVKKTFCLGEKDVVFEKDVSYTFPFSPRLMERDLKAAKDCVLCALKSKMETMCPEQPGKTPASSSSPPPPSTAKVQFRICRRTFAHTPLHRKMMELHSYCHQGCLEAVKKFVEEYGNGILEGQSRKGFRALHVAAMSLQYDVCEYLILERKVEVNCIARGGVTPLILALRSGGWASNRTMRVLRVLLDNGAGTTLNVPLYENKFKVDWGKSYRMRRLTPLAVAMRYSLQFGGDCDKTFLLLLSYLPEESAPQMYFIDKFDPFCHDFQRLNPGEIPGSQENWLRRFPAVDCWERLFFQGCTYDGILSPRARHQQLLQENESMCYSSLWHWLLSEFFPFHFNRGLPEEDFDHKVQIADWLLSLPGCGTDALLAAAHDMSAKKLCIFALGVSNGLECHFPDALHRVPNATAFGHNTDGKMCVFRNRTDLAPLLGEPMFLDLNNDKSVQLMLQRPGVFECVQV